MASDHTKNIIMLFSIIILVMCLQFALYSDFVDPPIPDAEQVDVIVGEDLYLYESPEQPEGVIEQITGSIGNGLDFLYTLGTFDIPQLPLFLRAIATTLFWLMAGITVILIIRGV